MRVSVIGCGYLGAVHAAAMAELGHEVVGIDVDERKIAALAAGRPPFFEPGLPEILTSATASGRLRFSTDIADAADAEVHFLAVGTPQAAGSNAADLRYVDAAFDGLLPHLADGALVVGKSTVPVGTAARLAARLAEAAPHASLAWNPEFLREGFAVKDTLQPDRLVYGVGDEHAASVLDHVYRAAIEAGTPRIVTDYATAELVKVAANAFLATKISFINAMSEIADATGCRCHRARRRHRPRRADRPAVPERGRGLRRRLPAEGHPGVHRARRGARARRLAGVPQGGRRDQPAAAAARRRPCRRGARRVRVPQAHRRARRHVQARLRRRARLAGARRGRLAHRARRGGRRDRPGGHRERAGAASAARVHRRRRRRRCAAPSSWCS